MGLPGINHSRRLCRNVIAAALAFAAFAKCDLLFPDDFESDTSLPTVARVFKPQTIEGLNFHKAAEALTPAQCAGSTVLHRAIMNCTNTPKTMYIVPHAAIEHDGEVCGTSGSDKRSEYMIIVPGKQLSDPRTAVINGLAPLYGLLSSNARAINAFNVLRGLDPIHVGFDYTSDRTCGGRVAYPQNTIYFFLSPSEGGQDLNFGFAYLAVSEIGMVTVMEDEQLCLYKQSRELGPGQAPFSSPTPSVTPGRNTNLPQGAFDLANPTNLPTCFPVENLVPLPASAAPNSQAPTRTPEAAVSITPTPSRIPTPSGTPSPNPTFSTPVDFSTVESPEPTVSEGPSSTASPTQSGSAPSTTPSPSRSTTSASNNNDAACFPSEAKVMLLSGSLIPISNLRIGDKVLTGPRKYSDVFMFTHNIDTVFSKFVRLTTLSNATLTLSPGHYIPVNGQFRAAQHLRAGDILTLGDGSADAIVSLEEVVGQGLHNPQTLDGQIVVDEIVVSTFTQAVDPSVAVSLLVPIKFLYSINLVTSAFDAVFSHGSTFFANLLPNGPAVW